MKKNNVLFVLLIFSAFQLFSKKSDKIIRSIFVPRSLTLNETLELGLGNYDFYNKQTQDNIPPIQVQAGYFNMRSRHSNRLASNFLPHRKTKISITENGSGDVSSLYFNVLSFSTNSFSETFSICPERKVEGGYFNFYFDFQNFSDDLCGWWGELAFAAAQVRHTLNWKDENVQNPGGKANLATFSDAMKSPDFLSGRIYDGWIHKNGVDDVLLKLGYNKYFGCTRHHVGLYLAGVVPTGHGTKAVRIFEPLIGSNHGKLGFGTNINYTVFANNCFNINWMLDARYLHAFKHTEWRSLDLIKNGDWSRYLPIVSADQTLNYRPGINCFTRKVRVHTLGQVDVWTALHGQLGDWHCEVDYNFFYRQEEKIKFIELKSNVVNYLTSINTTTNPTCIKTSLNNGIYDISGMLNKKAISASQTNISKVPAQAAVNGKNVAPSDTTFTYNYREDLNRKTGAAPKALTSTIACFLGYDVPIYCNPLLLGIGGFYEFDHKKTVYEQWGVYFKSSLTF